MTPAAKPKAEELRYFGEHGHWQHTLDPFVILHGPHGYMVQFLGEKERAAVDSEYQDMLGQLCKLKKVWCLPK